MLHALENKYPIFSYPNLRIRSVVNGVKRDQTREKHREQEVEANVKPRDLHTKIQLLSWREIPGISKTKHLLLSPVKLLETGVTKPAPEKKSKSNEFVSDVGSDPLSPKDK